MEIKAKDLRIGNFVYYPLIEFVYENGISHLFDYDKIFAIHSDSINTTWMNGLSFQHESHIKPIPITEEWLVRFGFESNNSQSNFSTYYNQRYDYRIEVYKDGTIYFDELCEIKYVHQLQNLYFALTGNELEVVNP